MVTHLGKALNTVPCFLMCYKNMGRKVGIEAQNFICQTLTSTGRLNGRYFSQLSQANALFFLERGKRGHSQEIKPLDMISRDFSSAVSKFSKPKQASFPHTTKVKSSISTTTFNWGEMGPGCCAPPYKGDCHEIEGALTLQADGKAHFSCVTWTDKTHSGDYWNVGFEFLDASGVTLFHSPMGRGPRMDDGNPPPRYRWTFDFTFDPTIYSKIHEIRQHFTC